MTKSALCPNASESMQAGLSSSYTLIGSGTGFPLVVPRRRFHHIQSPNGRGSYRFNPAAHHILVIYSAIKKASKVLKLSAVVRVPTHHHLNP